MKKQIILFSFICGFNINAFAINFPTFLNVKIDTIEIDNNATGADFNKIFNSKEFKTFLFENRLYPSKIEKIKLKYISEGSEKVVYRMKIVYQNEGYCYMKLAILKDYIDIKQFFERYEYLRNNGLFDNVFIPYFYCFRSGSDNVLLGEYQKPLRDKNGIIIPLFPFDDEYLYDEVKTYLGFNLFFRTYDYIKDSGFEYLDYKPSNIIQLVDNYDLKDFRIIDYPLTENGFLDFIKTSMREFLHHTLNSFTMPILYKLLDDLSLNVINYIKLTLYIFKNINFRYKKQFINIFESNEIIQAA